MFVEEDAIHDREGGHHRDIGRKLRDDVPGKPAVPLSAGSEMPNQGRDVGGNGDAPEEGIVRPRGDCEEKGGQTSAGYEGPGVRTRPMVTKTRK